VPLRQLCLALLGHTHTHKRAIAPDAAQIRPKYLSIEAVDCLTGKPQYFNLRLRTQAGTYIKEFCHGCVCFVCLYYAKRALLC